VGKFKGMLEYMLEYMLNDRRADAKVVCFGEYAGRRTGRVDDNGSVRCKQASGSWSGARIRGLPCLRCWRGVFGEQI
jgi:hypothetical protein